MSLDLYMREDIRRALEALAVSSGSTARMADQDGAESERLRVYCQGYGDALFAVALAFGIGINLPDVGKIAHSTRREMDHDSEGRIDRDWGRCPSRG